jgi:hypothetical protein
MASKFSSNSLLVGYWITAGIGSLMVLSTAIYAVVVEFLRRLDSFPSAGYAPIADSHYAILRIVLLISGVAIFLLLLFLRKSLLAGQRTGILLAGRSVAFIMTFIITTIFTYALCEAIALFGLVLFLMNGRRADFYLFFILSLLCYAGFFPRLSQWRKRAGELGIAN